MIGAIDPHSGEGLSGHLRSTEKNESIRIIAIQGLVAGDLDVAIKELMKLGCTSRTRQPIAVAFCSPSIHYSDDQWEMHWIEVEAEFGLDARPFIEVEHLKIGSGGRFVPHRHRVWSRIRPGGRVITFSHAGARMEKLSRIAEFKTGERLTGGRFNRLVADRLATEERQDIAQAMINAGLLEKSRPVTPTPKERQQSERCRDLAPDEIWKRAWDSYRGGRSGQEFSLALASADLKIAAGTRGPVLVSPGGAVTSLRRAVASGASAAHEPSPRKIELEALLAEIELPDLAAVKAQLVGEFNPGIAGQIGLGREPAGTASQTANSKASIQKDTDLRASWSEIATPSSAQPVGGPPDLRPDQRQPSSIRQLTQAQIAAMAAFEGAVAREASAAAQEIWDKALMEARQARGPSRIETVHQNQDKMFDARIQLLQRSVNKHKRDLELPSVGIPGWRASFKANLAPRSPADWVTWVQRADRDRTLLDLRSGEVIAMAEARVTSTKPTAIAASFLVYYAKAKGWKAVSISAGTPEWREQTARKAVRAGIIVENPELRAVVWQETRLVAQAQAALNTWKIERTRISVEPEDTGQRRKFLASLRACRNTPLARELLSRRNQQVLDSDLWELFKREEALQSAGSTLRPEEFEAFMQGEEGVHQRNSGLSPTPSL